MVTATEVWSAWVTLVSGGLGPRRRDDEAEADGGADEAGGCQQHAPAAGALIHGYPSVAGRPRAAG